MDDDLYIIPSDNVMIGQDDSFFLSGDQDLLSESESIVGPPGPPGPAGRDGRDGVDGQSATVTVGSTTTTAPGTDAIVTNVGDNLNAILNFSIPRGATGETGPAGLDGVDGVDGSDGFSPIATVTQTEYGATISITDSNGTTTADVVNGSAGTPGQAATVTVGSTTTGAAGTNASVTNSGTTSAAVLDFSIPRGADGSDGAPGQAATIAVGTTTTGVAGTNASVTNSGTSSAAVFNFTIPRGDTGAAGNDGQAATIAVGTTTTGAAGTNASVTNSGTSSAAVFNFTIPRGDTGPAGQGVVDYSSTEVDTGVKWINGSTIYRKVVSTGSGGGSSQINASLGTSISTIVSIDFYFKFGGYVFYKLWNVKEISCDTNGNLTVMFTQTLSAYDDAYFIVNYTK